MFCLTCRFASPTGSLYCSRCGRGFGCRICKSGHPNPMSATWCTACGKPRNELSEATLFVPLSWLSRLVCWSFAICLLLWVLRNPMTALWLSYVGALHVFAFVFATTPCGIVQALARCMAWLVVVCILSFFLPGAHGPNVRRSVAKVIVRLPGLTLKLIVLVARIMWRLVEGDKSSTTPKKVKSKGGGH